MPITVRVGGVPNGVVRIITDEGQVQQTSLPASGTATVTWTVTASLAASVRVEVRHPKADGTPGSGSAVTTDLPLGPMAALTNPIYLRRR